MLELSVPPPGPCGKHLKEHIYLSSKKGKRALRNFALFSSTIMCSSAQLEDRWMIKALVFRLVKAWAIPLSIKRCKWLF
jgi:hypothetical protein